MRTIHAAGLSAIALGLLVAAKPAKLELTSSDFKANGTLSEKQAFNGFGCSGENVSPALAWTDPPAGTQSFALLVHDPDAPTGSGWWHWVVYDIPADVRALPAGAGKADGSGLPKGAVQGATDFGGVGYGGPCPPPKHGKHHYRFMLYALKVPKLEVPPNATAAMIGFSANAAALGKAELIGLYERK